MIACVTLAYAAPLAPPPTVKAFAVVMIFTGGAAEAVAGRFGVHVARDRVDIALGFLSLTAAIALSSIRDDDAFLLTALLTLWLVARGLAELIGGTLSAERGNSAAAAWLARGAIDMLLGLLSLIGSLTTIWGQAIFGWPATIVRTILLFAAISLLVAGGLHVGLALMRGRGARGG
jgi:uncharacterized membrane protein HdeD (DUF308 family)